MTATFLSLAGIERERERENSSGEVHVTAGNEVKGVRRWWGGGGGVAGER